MTLEELHELMTQIAVKINQIAQLNFTIAATVEDGLRHQLAASKVLQASVENLLESTQLHKAILANHEDRIGGLES